MKTITPKHTHLYIQILNKKFKKIMMGYFSKHKITYKSSINSFLLKLTDANLAHLFRFLQNFDKVDSPNHPIDSSKIVKTSNKVFLVDSLEEQNFLTVESRPKPLRKKGKKYKSWRKFAKSDDIFWKNRILKKNFLIRFFQFEGRVISVKNNFPIHLFNQRYNDYSKKLIKTSIQQTALVIFLNYIMILNVILLRFFMYKLFFFKNANNSSNLL